MTESPEIPVELNTEPEPDEDGSSVYVHIDMLRAALMVAHAYNSDTWMALQHLINKEGRAR